MDALDQPIGDLRRAMPGNYEVKDPDTGPPRLVGHFTEWDTWTEIESLVEGHFFEQTPRAALTKTLQENRDRMRCLFQHGEDPQIGKKVIGPIEVLEADDVGPYYEVPLFKSVPDLVIDGLRAGQYGSSYTFRPTKRPTVVQRPSRSAFNPDGLPQRTLTEVRVIEFGPCVFNFYQGATASARSATDEAIVRRLLDDPERFQEIAKRAGISVPQLPYTDSAPAPGTTLYSVQLPPGGMPAEHRRAERLYKRAAEYAFETPWAVTPRILAVIQTILRERLSGLRPSAEEIQERISSGTSTISSDAAPAADGPVAVINVAGTIMPHAASFSNVSQSGTSIEDLQQQFRDAMASEDVKAILFNIDSPGGSAALVPEFGSEIRDARGTKPIIAVANTMAASAAYWIAASCDELYVSPSGQVGSIGVYSAHTDVSAEQEMQGVKTTLISAGEYKVEGNPFEPLSAEAQAQMQSQVDNYYQMFLDAVGKGRGVSAATVREEYGQGRMVMASDAVKAGMADGVATYEQTLAKLEKQAAKAPASRAEQLPASDPEPSVATSRTTPEPEPSVATTQTPATSGDDWMYGLPRKEPREWTL